MPWLEVSPSHWQRPLGENERMIKGIGDKGHAAGREHWSITVLGAFTLSGSLQDGKLEERLRRAWQLLRFRHPSIASTADIDTVNYLVPDAEALEQWTDETLKIVSDPEATSESLFASFKPSPYITGYFLPHTQKFALHAAHWRTDGYGALQLLNAFFDALASDLDPAAPSWGDEPSRLVPSIEEVLELPEKATPEILAATAECLRSGALVAGSIGLPYLGDLDTKPGGTHRIRRSLAQTATTTILAACQSRGITPLSAVHASLAAANYAGSSSANGAGHYTSTMRFSLRPYLKEPYNSAQYASALYTGSYMAKVPPSNSWEENAAEYNKLYTAGLSHEFLIARRQFAIQVQEMLNRTGNLGPPRSEVDISSVEDAEKLVSPLHRNGSKGGGLLEVKDISLGLECLARETYLFFWTFKGKIEFNLVYNEAFYDKVSMEKVMDSVVEGLMTMS
ncbi:hypothetical protein F4818DRAFT_417683 [Hypoxylon cercidicola]|nr:hypothetical protein F4818DRAFT_417683 [Hypoxylon cercidicola]